VDPDTHKTQQTGATNRDTRKMHSVTIGQSEALSCRQETYPGDAGVTYMFDLSQKIHEYLKLTPTRNMWCPEFSPDWKYVVSRTHRTQCPTGNMWCP